MGRGTGPEETRLKALVQRVTRAEVRTADGVQGRIEGGLAVLVCAVDGDTEEQAEYLARKIARMRIFRDDDGKTNRAIDETGGAVLAVSQFTLAAEWRKGNRPGFSRAAGPERGAALYAHFCESLRAEGLRVETGVFGAEMEVELVNDGPFTIWMDTEER